MNERKKTILKNNFSATVFILPFFLAYSVFTIWPLIQGVYVSLHKWTIMGKQDFIGLTNYTNFLKDSHFKSSLGNTTKFVIITVPMIMLLSFGLALLCNRPTKLKKIMRVSFYLPSVLSVAVISYIIRYMASPYTGFINSFLHSMGLSSSVEPLWLTNEALVWLTISVGTAWWTVGTSMLIYLAALQDISPELYEAAEVDGASAKDKLFRITIPLLKPTTWMIFLLQMIACFKVFGQIRLITGGGPGTATRPLIQYIYQQAFDRNNMGYASAMSYSLFLILIVLTLLQMFLSRRSEEK